MKKIIWKTKNGEIIISHPTQRKIWRATEEQFKKINDEGLKEYAIPDSSGGFYWLNVKTPLSLYAVLEKLLCLGFVSFGSVETEEQCLERTAKEVKELCPDANGILRSAIPQDAVRVADLDEENLPKTKEFRGAWTWTTKKPEIDIDFGKAQEITKGRLRVERKPLLEALDVETMKNIANTAKLVEIEAQKQTLRDVTGKVDECKTLEELKAIKVGQ